VIGGTDVTMPTRAGATALDICLRAIRWEWAEAVFEDALTGANFSDYSLMSLAHLAEVFVFRDKDIAREWESRGSQPDLENTMIHLKLSDDSITLVVDDPSEPIMERILATIKDGLFMDILNIPAKLETRAA
jgi:hypothetical protein